MLTSKEGMPTCWCAWDDWPPTGDSGQEVLLFDQDKLLTIFKTVCAVEAGKAGRPSWLGAMLARF